MTKPAWKFNWSNGNLSYRPCDGVMPPTSVVAKVREKLKRRSARAPTTFEGTFDGDCTVCIFDDDMADFVYEIEGEWYWGPAFYEDDDPTRAYIGPFPDMMEARWDAEDHEWKVKDHPPHMIHIYKVPISH